MSAIEANLQAVRQRISDAAGRCGRSAMDITLLAVSKTRPARDVVTAALAGQRDFGENYAQEGADKILALRALAQQGALPENAALIWHFIGPLQSNKTRLVAEQFDWAHSIERLKIAERLSAQRPAQLPPLQVCVQVNVSGEASKSGCPPQEALDLCLAVASLPRLKLRGLMCIPAPAHDFAAQCRPFLQLWQRFMEIKTRCPELDTLSMGMSDDLEAAVQSGGTLVRVGSAIFGQRESGKK
ncbi:MAG: YggS family pyridoxal phosphate-dependent enzyme [Zoogloeaceae bacterium]|jgi:pyridoxal phosphate enzyme (YggS family)|nr:YggS family pyridoxal phosphate-dependent enzyme [Zoogloeaceae bacterium]